MTPRSTLDAGNRLTICLASCTAPNAFGKTCDSSISENILFLRRVGWSVNRRRVYRRCTLAFLMFFRRRGHREENNYLGHDLPAGARHYRAFVGPPQNYDIIAAMQFNLLTG